MQLDLRRLLGLIEHTPAFGRLLSALQEKQTVTVSVLDAAKSYLIASLQNKASRRIVIVTGHPEKARKLAEQIQTWSGNENVRILPELDTLEYERITADKATDLERLQALASLVGTEDGKGPQITIVPAAALIQKLPDHDTFTRSIHSISKGMDADPLELVRKWQAMGYSVEDTVDVPGTVSRRGGILDIFPPMSEYPARLEFFGNTIESIRLFNPDNQRSVKSVPSILVCPATELLWQTDSKKEPAKLDLSGLNKETGEQFEHEIGMLTAGESLPGAGFYSALFNEDCLLSYLKSDALLIMDEPSDIKLAVEDLNTKAEELRQEKVKQGELPPDFPRPYFKWDELEPKLKDIKTLRVTGWGLKDDQNAIKLDFTPVNNYSGQLPTLIKKVKESLKNKERVVLVSHQASRLAELFQEQDIFAAPVTELKQPPAPGSLVLVNGMISEGWTMGDTSLFTDAEVFGFIKQRRFARKRPVPHHKLFTDFTSGDYVVHIEHGIGKFVGVIMMGGEKGEKEYLVIEYAAGDKLYVPSDQIDRVGRYVGTGEQPPVLSRLGTQEWAHTKEKVKESVELIAKDLIDLYAAREVVPGYAFSPDTVWQGEMEGAFPYVETPDQLEVQAQVKEDMERAKPMDRLVCGDVGYGKTEVAVRAAFKAVMDAKQVAVLVPTTVLAQQHYSTFRERMSAFPVRIDVLSRFRSDKEQKEIVQGLAEGTVDICIGTHRLIQKDIVFKNLGLVVVDEEQRFGVGHKEFLKKLRKEVDVLTLSATPIPRTLHMSLVGVRDMSVMETPPEARLPVKTFVAEYSERLIREAIIRELEREGQVFFVHNRVQNIVWMAEQIRQIVPEARIGVGHGQMAEGELEKVMSDFLEHRIDVLVCTTIIESGLDMPSVNTLIINHADKFGLTQLYQLRGRVGRGANLAYAYLLYDKGKRLSMIAEKRLKTIYEATELGAGFGIAMKDLEIRGAGTLLGLRQSGHITAVGFNLYTELLSQAVEQEKARRAGTPPPDLRPANLPSPGVDLPIPAFIPEEYVPDLNTRLGLYQKLMKVSQPGQLDEISQEFTDRFGPVPTEVRNLLFTVKIKSQAVTAGIQSISTTHGEIVITLFEGLTFEAMKIGRMMRELMVPDNTFGFDNLTLSLNFRRIGPRWREVLDGIVRRLA